MNKNLVKTLLMTARPSFLILTPACILLGVSTALYQNATLDLFWLALILIGGVSAHISVNILNEYLDFKSGLDLQTIKTAFSGGSGALPNHPEAAKTALITGLSTLFITIAIGIGLLFTHENLILPIGLLGIALVITYTRWINRIPLLCLIAPGLGFGVLMVVGTHVVIAGSHSTLAWRVSIIPFLLINNLLLLNQYPDIHADASIGRRTWPIVYGTQSSNVVYIVFAISSYGLITYDVLKGYIPSFGLLALIPIIFSFYAGFGAVKHGSNLGHYPKHLAANVLAALLTPLLLAIAILIG